ncbi:unnamed protein product [Didymodactylos carnosus]|uniref:Uncharacterized protein n=1 Tax=Didymodactylos carnosus TaxID=1234261 RepID=A0A815T8U0_9BILA|nr:unnamed protein product [Didymodactylos carnosus]CAF1497906.1 unnamed protein product [Didymodactylos carnosus]CAF3823306.1 unnamed protein product [Didymodactylos carnosus]CAF4359995.1 unnamed protein product [Didymodactylos carnosus]
MGVVRDKGQEHAVTIIAEGHKQQMNKRAAYFENVLMTSEEVTAEEDEENLENPLKQKIEQQEYQETEREQMEVDDFEEVDDDTASEGEEQSVEQVRGPSDGLETPPPSIPPPIRITPAPTPLIQIPPRQQHATVSSSIGSSSDTSNNSSSDSTSTTDPRKRKRANHSHQNHSHRQKRKNHQIYQLYYGKNLFDIHGTTPIEFSRNILRQIFIQEELKTRRLPGNRKLKKLNNGELVDRQLNEEKIKLLKPLQRLLQLAAEGK